MEVADELQNLDLKGKSSKLGLLPLAAKKPRNTKGKPVVVETNVRKLTLSPNQPIYKYSVQVVFFFTRKDGTLCSYEVSKSAKRGKPTEHENDKQRCQLVYQEAVKRFEDLRKGGPYFYDRQASLYSFHQLKNETLTFSVKEGISKDPDFDHAEFVLTKVKDSFQSTSNDVKNTVNACPGRVDRTLLEAINVIVSGPAFENPNVITCNNCTHYLIDQSQIETIPYREYKEGGLYSGVGASKAVKTLEGPAQQGKAPVPTLYMSAEMKTTLFHPDHIPLIDLFGTFQGFNTSLKHNHPAAARMAQAFIGVDVLANYGKYKNLLEDGLVMTIRGFGEAASSNMFEVEDGTVSVAQYFKKKYSYILKYPNLFTIEVKGKFGKIFIPAEVLLLAKSQSVTNNQMINNEQADMIKMSAAPPHIRKPTTDSVVKSVGLAATNIANLVKVDAPQRVEGILLEKPKVLFSGNRQADLNNQRAKIPTDFVRAGQFFDAKPLSNWEVCFMKGEEVKGVAEQLVSEMSINGMKVKQPSITYIQNGNLKQIFESAKAANREMIFFVIKSRYNIHQNIKIFEQQYDILTQEIRLETAERMFRQPQTRQNIVNKVNMKLGGLNYLIQSESFNNPGRLIIGFETSERSKGSDMPAVVGFAANMMDQFQKFSGGYVFTKQGGDVYGPIITDTVLNILKTTKKNRPNQPPTDILIYLNRISEGQFALVNEEYSQHVKKACQLVASGFRPHITIIAASKFHNERIYKSDQGRISNLEPGTVVDHTIVSPVYNEWYHTSAVARQGTTKPTKFTIIFTTNPNEPMWNLETLTNDLCYEHQIVFHPVSLPAPLYVAGRCGERGSMLLANVRPVFNADKTVNLEATNEKLGYGKNKLFGTRFNA